MEKVVALWGRGAVISAAAERTNGRRRLGWQRGLDMARLTAERRIGWWSGQIDGGRDEAARWRGVGWIDSGGGVNLQAVEARERERAEAASDEPWAAMGIDCG